MAERWMLARLRNRTFFGLGQLREAIQEALVDLNNRPFQKMDGCRRSYFENIDKPALQPLPSVPYELALWKKARAPAVDTFRDIELGLERRSCYGRAGTNHPRPETAP